MRYSRRAVIGVSVAAGLLGVGSVALILSSPQTHAEGTFALRGVYAAFLLLIGWGFTGTGLYAWSRRPGNAIGPLMTAAGLAWLLRGLGVSDNSVLFSIGELAAPAAFALLAHLLLAFPSGHLETPSQRRLAALAYVNATALQAAAFVITDTRAPDAGCDGCPPNPILIFNSSSLAGLVILLQLICSFVLLIGLVLTMLRRWRRATAGQRRSLSPVLSAGALTLFFLASALVAGAVGAAAAADAALIAALTLFACVPFAFLVGLLRSRLGRAEAVSLVVGKLGAGAGRSALRDTLAQALGDPGLEVAYWVPEISSYVESDGRPVALPGTGSGKFATRISHGGDPVAAVIHDASLEDDGDLVQAVGAAVALTLRSERLDAELQVRVAELQASRARIVQAGDEQRRRIERDLHDGAQQRLMALGINLRLARDRVEHHAAEAIELLDTSLHELNEATAELRELARGIHPAILTNRGLDAALKGLATRSPTPVEIVDTPNDRLPPPIESAVYFIVAEALTNAARYATASSVTVSVSHHNGVVEVRVRDDGIGGADPQRGSGLRGLHDRVAALNGRLALASMGGEGTTLTARLPCG
jgi:signal transduction histidine kinase